MGQEVKADVHWNGQVSRNYLNGADIYCCRAFRGLHISATFTTVITESPLSKAHQRLRNPTQLSERIGLLLHQMQLLIKEHCGKLSLVPK